MSAFPAFALAAALTWVVADFLNGFLPTVLTVPLGLVLCFVIFRVVNHYLKTLKE